MNIVKGKYITVWDTEEHKISTECLVNISHNPPIVVETDSIIGANDLKDLHTEWIETGDEIIKDFILDGMHYVEGKMTVPVSYGEVEDLDIVEKP